MLRTGMDKLDGIIGKESSGPNRVTELEAIGSPLFSMCSIEVVTLGKLPICIIRSALMAHGAPPRVGGCRLELSNQL